MARPDRTHLLRRALAHYLRSNGQACDSASGIARWWMPPGLDVGEAELEPVLAELVARGLLRQFSTLDGSCLYRRPRVDAAGDLELEQMTRD